MTPERLKAEQALCKHIFPNDHKAPSWRWVECIKCGIWMGEVVSQEDWDRMGKV